MMIRSGIELIVDTRKADFRGIANDAGKADKALDGVVDSANRAERALNGLSGDVNVGVAVDTSRVDAALNVIDGLTQSETVTVDTDTSKVESAQTDIDNLSQSEEVSVTAKTTDVDAAIKDISSKLEVLQSLAVIDIVMNLPTGLLESPLFTAISDTETAVDRITAMTGQEIPQAAGLINTLYSEAWTKSRDDIADVIIELERLGVAQTDYEEAARTAFQVAAVTGKEPLEVLQAMNKLVANDLAPSFDGAGDFIVKGFQEGFDRSGDFLDTINEYSPVLAQSGVTIGGFFDILQSGLDSGAYNTDRLIDSFKEMTNLTKEEVAIFNFDQTETDRTKALSQLGLMDEATAYTEGKTTGDEFAAGVLDAIRAVEDPAEQQRLAKAIFSPTMVEDAGLANLLAIDFENSTELQAAWEGVAADAATALTDNLNGAMAEFIALIETELVTALDEAFDLTGRMDIAKEQFQDFIAAIREGKGFGEAIEIAFGVEGVDTALTNIERVFGNLLIGILEAVAFIQDPSGTTDADKGTREEIARLAEGQLAFDLQIVNADEIKGTIQTAVDRGVEQSAIADGIGTAINEAIASGDVERAALLSRQIADIGNEPIVVRGIEFAAGTSSEDILATLMPSTMSKGILGQAGEQAILEEEIKNAISAGAANASPQVQAAVAEAGRAAREAFFAELQAGNVGEALNIAGALDDPAMIAQASQAANELFLAAEEAYNDYDFSTLSLIADQLQDPGLQARAQELGAFLREQAMFAFEQGDLISAKKLATDLGDPELMAAFEEYKNTSKTASRETAQAATISVEQIAFALNREAEALDAQKPYWTAYADEAILDIDRIGERITFVGDQTKGLTDQLAAGTGGGTGGVGDGGMADGGTLAANRIVRTGEEGEEWFVSSHAGAIINAANTSALMSALGSIGFGGQTVYNNYNINMSNTNHMQNQAQADAFGYRAGTALRGF